MQLSLTNGRRILIVDDDREIAAAAALRLQSAGYSTIVAEDACAALRLLQESKPDAILLDVRMPGMDGLALLRRLRSQSDTRNLPVVMFSASLADEREALKAGARFFLAKPYSGSELLHVVQCVLTSSGSRRVAELHSAQSSVLVRQGCIAPLVQVISTCAGV